MFMRKIHRDIAKETGRTDAREHFERFRDYHMAIGSWSWDWTEAWRNWCLKSVEFERREAPAREGTRA